MGAVEADRVDFSRIRRDTVLDPDLMPPMVAHIVDVGEFGALAEPESGQGSGRQRQAQLGRAVGDRPDHELVEMEGLPAHGHLHDAVQFLKAIAVRHQHAPPDHGADVQEPDLQLQD
jgi:hypothetical protein